MAIRPGDLTTNPVDYSAYVGSMAAEIETQLNRLLDIDGLPQLPFDVDDREVRDRRRLFIAIARAVVKHLKDEANSIDIPHDAAITHPVFHTDGI
jgi:hypothetical protein